MTWPDLAPQHHRLRRLALADADYICRTHALWCPPERIVRPAVLVVLPSDKPPSLTPYTTEPVVSRLRETLGIPARPRAEVRTAYDRRCEYCSRMSLDPDERWELDHRLAVWLGGATVFENLVPACSTCNAAKNAQLWVPGHRLKWTLERSIALYAPPPTISLFV